MKDHKELIRKYLGERYMMQLATIDDGQPWCCTVYFVADDELNLYWASMPDRRHSQEIANHSKVAAAIPVEFTLGKKVVGVQAEGEAVTLDDPKLIRPIAEKYAQKFDRTNEWVEDISSNKTDHKFYKLTPKMFVLFDEQNFPHNTRKEWEL